MVGDRVFQEVAGIEVAKGVDGCLLEKQKKRTKT